MSLLLFRAVSLLTVLLFSTGAAALLTGYRLRSLELAFVDYDVRGLPTIIRLMDTRRMLVMTLAESGGIELYSDPVWSPDGQHLLFRSFARGVTRMRLVDLIGRNLGTIAEDVGGYAWSPDSQSIVYTQSPTAARSHESVHITELVSGQSREVLRLHTLATFGDLHWSPDGESIVLMSSNPLESSLPRIHFLSPGNGHQVQIERGDLRRFSSMIWSADSQSILFAPAQQNIFDLVEMDIDGQEQARHPIMSGGVLLDNIALSPDGAQIAFSFWWDVTPDLYVANLDGSGLRLLADVGSIDLSPAWSPDGRHIAFVSATDYELKAPQIYVVDSDGRYLRLLAESAHSPAWRP